MKQNNIFYEWQIVRIKSREELQELESTVLWMIPFWWQETTILKIFKDWWVDRFKIDTDQQRFSWSPNCFEEIKFWRNDFIL